MLPPEYSVIGGNEGGNRQRVVVRGSLREKLPPSLKVKAANLRVLQTIGQGTNNYNDDL